MEIVERAAKENGLVAAFAFVGLVVMVSGFLSRKLTFGRVARPLPSLSSLASHPHEKGGKSPAGRKAWRTSRSSAASV